MHRNIKLNCFMCDFKSKNIDKWLSHLSTEHCMEIPKLTHLLSRRNERESKEEQCLYKNQDEIPFALSETDISQQENVQTTAVTSRTNECNGVESVPLQPVAEHGKKAKLLKRTASNIEYIIKSEPELYSGQDINNGQESSDENILNLRNEQVKFVCGHCDKAFMTLSGYKRHQAGLEAISNSVQGESNLSIVPSCSSEDSAFWKGSAEALKCSQCSQTFTTAAKLQSHIQMHCHICPYIASSRTVLERHLRGHRQEKIFACPLCDFRAVVQSSVVLHMRTHTDERPFRCNQCDYSARTSSQLISHKLRHSGAKPYQCKVCGKRFTQAGSLGRHRKRESCIQVDLALM
ncbi:hypothetical protein RRG08_033661 [Elysia crispata]|uniref:C2H2-type domain-containing protein n=1 Tax=Elysia crispata TaxID=231223 RepID=A0AAE1A8R6_9GAST|nr:hypothetical protein RRG08_033661 [Elysia crispata]